MIWFSAFLAVLYSLLGLTVLPALYVMEGNSVTFFFFFSLGIYLYIALYNYFSLFPRFCNA